MRFGQAIFRDAIAELKRRLTAFLIIDHEIHGEFRIAWPLRIGRIGAVADKISRDLIGHGVNSCQGEAAFWKARQIFSGVAGISGAVAPRSASASAMAFMTVCGAAMAPA